MLKRGTLKSNKKGAEEGFMQWLIIGIILVLLFMYLLWDKVFKNVFD